MLEIFDQVPCWFRILGLGSMSVEDIDVPDQSPGAGITYGRLTLHRDPVDGKDDAF